MNGILYGASLGPGCPGLITRRVWDLLQGQCRWAYPIKNHKKPSYALQIAIDAGLTPPPNALALLFPMTHDTDILQKHWHKSGQQVLEVLQRGEDVVFLVEGDASTFSTFQHLAQAVKFLDDTCQIITIPGVPSFNAAAALAAIPLAGTSDTIAIIPAGYGISVIENALPNFDTIVLLKVKPLLDDIIAFAVAQNLIPNCYFAEKVGTPEQTITHNILELQGKTVNYLSLVVVHNPNRNRGEMAKGCKKRN